MVIIIDGYNLLKLCYGDVHIDERQRNLFLRDVGRYGMRKGNQMVVVFDGGPYDRWSKEVMNKVVCIYSGTQQSADDYIKDYIEDHAKKDMVLVSSDRELLRHADRYNIPTIAAGVFLRLLKEALVADHAGGAQGVSELVKTSAHENEELDALMESIGNVTVQKSEDLSEQIRRDRLSHGSKLSKRERHLVKKIKKL